MPGTDETSKLLRPNWSTPNGAGLSSEGQSKNLRPPMYSLPSTHSIRSMKSISNLNNPIIDDFVTRKSKLFSDDGSILPFAESERFDRFAYYAYYIPILKWLPNYDFKQNFFGDILAGMSMASFQIPLVMSFATSLAHLPPLSGIYSVIIGSCIYAILGCVPVLVVGPSPSTALIYGQAVQTIMHELGNLKYSELEISAAISAGMGGILLASGILRFGYLDNILSRALLKGFIAAMGCIMIINELAPELGLTELASRLPHLTILDKVWFVIMNYGKSHKLTAIISIVTLILVLFVRNLKFFLIKKYKKPSLVYIPELLMMVIFSTYLSSKYNWEEQGVEIVGELSSSGSITYVNPFQLSKSALYRKVFSTSFLCTILGYFDSTTATKALDTQYNYNVSSNRELIALGATNFIISVVGGLPSFGALGRSKINIMAGAKTPMAAISMAIVTVFVLFYLLPYLNCLPECVLALSTTVVGITVLGEIPLDLSFFWSIKGYSDLGTFFVVFATTLLWSAEAGVFLGSLIAVVRVIKYGTTSRIQILGRIPNTMVFRNADELIEESFNNYIEDDNLESKFDNMVAQIEEIEGVLIIKIPEPLNFANVSDLKNKLTRIEKYGSLLVHPSQPSRRPFDKSTIKNIIIDCKGMNSIDASATQVLNEVIQKYVMQYEISVYFSRVPVNNEVRSFLKNSGIVEFVNNSLKSSSGNLNSRDTSFLDSLAFVGSSLGPGFFLSIEDALKIIELQDI